MQSDAARECGRARARTRLPIEMREQFLAAIYAGQPFRQVLRDSANLKPGLGLTKTDPGWSAALEAALTAARRDDLEHGTNAAYVSVQGVSGAPAAEDGQTRTKSVQRSSHSVRERLGWCGLRETHGGALGVVCSAVWAWLGRLLRPAALLPATASPRSRMRFMITLGLTNQIIAFACIPPDA